MILLHNAELLILGQRNFNQIAAELPPVPGIFFVRINSCQQKLLAWKASSIHFFI